MLSTILYFKVLTYSKGTKLYAFHPKGSQKCAYPVIVGGGNKVENATVIILEKKKDELKIKVLNAQGETLLDI